MRLLTGFLLTATAAGAVIAKQGKTTNNYDKYAAERGFKGHIDPHEHAQGHLHAREADADAVAAAAWEKAHGGSHPIYKPNFGTAEIHGQHGPRSVEEDLDDDVDTSLEGYDHELGARSADSDDYDEKELDVVITDDGVEGVDPSIASDDLDKRDVPDFGDEEVDTSLEGYGEYLHARGLEFDGDVDTSLAGYDDTEEDEEEDELPLSRRSADDGDYDEKELDVVITDDGVEGVDPSLDIDDLSKRDVPDFGDMDVDTSLDGYDHALQARDLEDDDDEGDDDEEPSIFARSWDFWNKFTGKVEKASANVQSKVKSVVSTHMPVPTAGLKMGQQHHARDVEDSQLDSEDDFDGEYDDYYARGY